MNNNVFQPSLYYPALKSLRETGIKLFIFSALIILIANYLSLIHVCAASDWFTDYFYFYLSGEQALTHEDIYYPLHFFTHLHMKVVNLNLPFVGILMMPFRFSNYTTSFWVFSLIGIILCIISILLIIKKVFQPRKKIVYCIGILLALSYYPVFLNTKQGQIGTIVLWLTTLGWLSFREKKSNWAGFFWGMAFSVKLFVGLFLWMLLWQKEWQALKIFLITSIVCALMSLFIFKPDIYLHYLSIFKQIDWYNVNWNASLLGFLGRIFGHNQETNIAIYHFPLLTQILYMAFAAALLCMLPTFSKKNPTSIFSKDLSVAFTITAMLIISPLGWIYYFPLLFIPFAIIFYWNQNKFHQTMLHYLLAISIFFSSYPSPLSQSHQIVNLKDIFLFSGIYFYALCILMIIFLKMRASLKTPKFEMINNFLSHSTIAALYTTALIPSFLGILSTTHAVLLLT